MCHPAQAVVTAFLRSFTMVPGGNNNDIRSMSLLKRRSFGLYDQEARTVLAEMNGRLEGDADVHTDLSADAIEAMHAFV